MPYSATVWPAPSVASGAMDPVHGSQFIEVSTILSYKRCSGPGIDMRVLFLKYHSQFAGVMAIYVHLLKDIRCTALLIHVLFSLIESLWTSTAARPNFNHFWYFLITTPGPIPVARAQSTVLRSPMELYCGVLAAGSAE